MSTAESREQVLLLGDPGLRKVCSPVVDFDALEFRQNGGRLIRALEQFRAERWVRVAAERSGRVSPDAPRRPGSGDDSGRVLDRVRAARHVGLHGPVRRQSGKHDQPESQHVNRARGTR